MNSTRMFDEDLFSVLRSGKVAVIPTDTLYGVVARAEDEQAVEKLYRLKGRDEGKPCIVLISSVEDLSKFGVVPDEKARQFATANWPLNAVWDTFLEDPRNMPAPLSILFPCPDKAYSYLHRGTNEIAFRIPLFDELRGLIERVGPLVAPSANPQGLPPAKTIDEAKKYFGEKVDVYVDGGVLDNPPSTLIRFEHGKPTVLRAGAWTPHAL